MKQVNKEQAYLRLKSLKSKKPPPSRPINKSTQLSSLPSQPLNLKLKFKQNDSILNVSLIQPSSFTSNKHDGSLDSMDKMIIGVSALGIDQKQFQQNQDKYAYSKSSNDLDFNEIHKQYQLLIGKCELLGEEESEDISESVEENSRVLPDQDQWQLKQPHPEKRLSLSLSPKKSLQTQIDFKHHLLKIQSQIDSLKHKKNLDNSNNSIKIFVTNLGNLSQIHQQRQNLLNTTTDAEHKRNNEQDEQQFIDFVSQPDPQQPTQNNQKKNQFDQQHEANQWLGAPVLQNLQLQLQKDKQQKNYQQLPTYHPILQALNTKQQYQPQHKYLQILKLRQQWIKNHSYKSLQWKNKQLYLLNKIKKIINNPHYDSSESQD